MGKPTDHLVDDILLVARAISILRIVDVEALRRLRVVVISRTQGFDGSDIVEERM